MNIMNDEELQKVVDKAKIGLHEKNAQKIKKASTAGNLQNRIMADMSKIDALTNPDIQDEVIINEAEDDLMNFDRASDPF